MDEIQELRDVVRAQSRLLAGILRLLEEEPEARSTDEIGNLIDEAFDDLTIALVDRHFPELAGGYPIARPDPED